MEELLSRLEGVRQRQGNRWSARCPAHADRSPSLSIKEGDDGRLLLHCFAGCDSKSICNALGLTLADLFSEASKPRTRGSRMQRKPRPPQWRETAAKLQDHARALWLRSEDVLRTARGMDTSEWNDDDFSAAITAIARAYEDRERSDLLEGVAFDLRCSGLNTERQNDRQRRAA